MHDLAAHVTIAGRRRTDVEARDAQRRCRWAAGAVPSSGTKYGSGQGRSFRSSLCRRRVWTAFGSTACCWMKGSRATSSMSEFLAATADLTTDDSCRRVVRHGHLLERQIMTGIEPAAVRSRACATGRRRRRSGAHPLQACNPAALRPAFEEPRYADPGPLPERRVDRRLRACAGRLARQGCSWLVGHDHRAAEGGLDRRT